MIVVKNAWHKRGYSGLDHLLADSELEPIIGRQFRSVNEAKEAAERLSSGTSGRANVPIGVECLFADGSTRTF